MKNDEQEKRFDWALEYRNLDFSNVIFADECSIWMRERNGKMWIKKGQEHYSKGQKKIPLTLQEILKALSFNYSLFK